MNPDPSLTPETMPQLPGFPPPTGLNTDNPTTPEVEFPSGPAVFDPGYRGVLLPYTTIPSAEFPTCGAVIEHCTPDFVGAGFDYDKFDTKDVVEVGDFSSLTQVSLGFKATTTQGDLDRIKVEFISVEFDMQGNPVIDPTTGKQKEHKSTVYLNGITSNEKIWSI